MSKVLTITQALPSTDWMRLRALARTKGKTLPGSAIRLVPSRQTKDGKFLAEFVKLGLLVYVSGDESEPFEAKYKLTELGEHAAEYGEYKRQVLSKGPRERKSSKSRVSEPEAALA